MQKLYRYWTLCQYLFCPKTPKYLDDISYKIHISKCGYGVIMIISIYFLLFSERRTLWNYLTDMEVLARIMEIIYEIRTICNAFLKVFKIFYNIYLIYNSSKFIMSVLLFSFSSLDTSLKNSSIFNTIKVIIILPEF